MRAQIGRLLLTMPLVLLLTNCDGETANGREKRALDAERRAIEAERREFEAQKRNPPEREHHSNQSESEFDSTKRRSTDAYLSKATEYEKCGDYDKAIDAYAAARNLIAEIPSERNLWTLINENISRCVDRKRVDFACEIELLEGQEVRVTNKGGFVVAWLKAFVNREWMGVNFAVDREGYGTAVFEHRKKFRTYEPSEFPWRWDNGNLVYTRARTPKEVAGFTIDWTPVKPEVGAYYNSDTSFMRALSLSVRVTRQ